MNQIFLGEPVQEIKNWFIETFPSWPDYTTLKFADGTTQTKEILGAATWQNIGVKSDEWHGDNTLKSCQLGNKVTELSYGVFCVCYSLTSIKIPNSVTLIDGCAFYNCPSLTSISIPDSVSSIGSQAFSACRSLTSITIPSSVISIGNDPFGGIANANCGDYRSLTSVIFAGRTIEQVQAMEGYPWEIDDISIISAELS